MTKVLKINDAQMGELYSIYCLPNMILPLFAGQIIDYYGTKVMMWACFWISLLGNLIFALGGCYNSWTTILIGRCLFGIGCEIFGTCIYVMLTVWFIGSNLNLAYGLNGVAPCIAAILGGYYSPRLFGTSKDPHLGRALLMGVYLTALSVVFLIPMISLDEKRKKQEETMRKEKVE